jgi:hypothetical protein
MTGIMPPPRYKPVKDERFFNRVHRYCEIDWNDKVAVFKEFKLKLEDWYINPIKLLTRTEHAGFTAVALSCVLVDTLAQYSDGILSSKRSSFIGWLKNAVPETSKPFPTSILKSVKQPADVEAHDFAEAIYYGFRCGILHEAHPKLYAGIWGMDQAMDYRPKGVTLYEDGTDCPSVVIDPAKLFALIERAFEDYFSKLLSDDPQFEPLRKNFQHKFLASYGINIGNEH